MKRILTVGGGSGGHVTPVAAVIGELKEKHPQAEIRFWCDSHFAPQARRIMAGHTAVKVQTVSAGKFRRYQHLSKLQHLTIPTVVFPNIFDAFRVAFGVVQSVVRLAIWRPDVVFANGGYVCLPVGLATKVLGIPLVIHDADAVAGLTNRTLAPIAKQIMTGLPLSHFDYPAEKAKYVGIAIDPAYRIVSDDQRRKLKKALGFDASRPLVVFAGGGLGSRQINDAVAVHLDELMKFTNVLLVSGAGQYDELRSLTPTDDKRFQLKDFVPGLREIFSAADVVVSRAGATTLLELAALATPTIVIPSKRLKWQVEHADHFVAKKAVLLLDEDMFDEPKDTSLVDTVRRVVNDSKLRRTLGNNLHDMARPHAARDMARIIERAAHK